MTKQEDFNSERLVPLNEQANTNVRWFIQLMPRWMRNEAAEEGVDLNNFSVSLIAWMAKKNREYDALARRKPES